MKIRIGNKTDEFHRIRQRQHKPALIVLTVIGMIYAFSLLYPFFWIFYNSLKTAEEFAFNPIGAPTNMQWQNYLLIFKTYNIAEMLGNSIILCLAVPTVAMFSTCAMAYGLSKYNFRGKTILYYMAISVMFIPTVGTLPATYALMDSLGIIDTHIGLVLLESSGMGFNFLLMSSIFKNISIAYKEAAEMDGAGNWRIFLQVMLPQTVPMLVPVWILSFIGIWNGYQMPVLFLPSHKTVSVGLKAIADIATSKREYPALFAAIIVMASPMVILFICFQKKIMQMNLGGGIKG